jgi:hypothetical protein
MSLTVWHDPDGLLRWSVDAAEIDGETLDLVRGYNWVDDAGRGYGGMARLR